MSVRPPFPVATTVEAPGQGDAGLAVSAGPALVAARREKKN